MTISTTAEIIDRLNAYTGADVWQDIILGLGEYTEAGTQEIDQGTNDRFVTTLGTIIRYDQQTGRWYDAGDYQGTASDDAMTVDHTTED